jgi:rhodanese-related sulfurtransferase
MPTDINREELRAQIRAGGATIVDALPVTYFDQQHLPGAINIAPDEADEKAPDLLPDRSALVITYCSNPSCNNSHVLARRLEGLGYTNVRTYRAGIEDWVAAGLATESSAAA